MEKKKNRKYIVLRLIAWALIMLGFLVLYALKWSYDEYGQVPFAQIVFHLQVPLAGTSRGLIWNFIGGYLKACFGLGLLLLVLFFVVPYILNALARLRDKKLPAKLPVVAIIASLAVGAGFLAFTLVYAWNYMGVSTYIYDMSHPTTLYEDNYVDTAEANITFPEKKKNLIYLFLESMEISYTTEEYGGKMKENLIPNLTELALENETFSAETGTVLSGGISTTNTTWTVGAMVAQTAGIPLSIPINVNSYGRFASFLPGATTLGDVMQKEGYNLEIMMGSKATFGGRESYFTQHGEYSIFDYRYAVKIGKIPSDYYEFWGFEDAKLFEYAKEELTSLAAKDEPFNFTLLTVDTHFPNGYVCDLCDDEFSTDMENAIACSDRQVTAFVEWIKQQDFYEDTVIVIAGDHPNMGNIIKNRINDEDYERLVYFTIINSDTERATTGARTFTTMDIFPTTLSAIGCTIEGDRLGLGTDLYSATPTLVEEMGLDALNTELAKTSLFYNNELIGE